MGTSLVIGLSELWLYKKVYYLVRSGDYQSALATVSDFLERYESPYVYVMYVFLYHKINQSIPGDKGKLTEALETLVRRSRSFRIARNLRFNFTIPFLTKFADQLYYYHGVCPLLLRFLDIGRGVFSKNALFKRQYAKYMIRYACVLVEAGRGRDAVQAYQKAYALLGQKASSFMPKYLALTASITKECPGHAMSSQRILNIYNAIEHCRGTFRDMIIKHRGDFCIVGNSPCESGSGKGPIIDKFSMIIRFNNFSTDYPRSNDYGTKTTVWCKMRGYSEVMRNDCGHLNLIIPGANDNLTYNYKNAHDYFEEYVDLGMKVEQIPYKYLLDLRSYGFHAPSHGLMIMYWIYKIQGLIDAKQVFGFKMIDQKASTSNSHFNHQWQLKDQVYYHEWEKEHAFLRGLIRL